MVTSSENIPGIRYRVGIDVGLRSIGFCAIEVDRDDQPVKLLNSMVFIQGYRTKRVGFMVTFPLFGAEKSVLKLVGANLKDGQNVLVL